MTEDALEIADELEIGFSWYVSPHGMHYHAADRIEASEMLEQLLAIVSVLGWHACLEDGPVLLNDAAQVQKICVTVRLRGRLVVFFAFLMTVRSDSVGNTAPPAEFVLAQVDLQMRLYELVKNRLVCRSTAAVCRSGLRRG